MTHVKPIKFTHNYERVYEFDNDYQGLKAGSKFIMNDQLFRVTETEGTKIRAEKIMKKKTWYENMMVDHIVNLASDDIEMQKRLNNKIEEIRKEIKEHKTMKTKKHKVEISEPIWKDQVRILRKGLQAAKTDLEFDQIKYGYMNPKDPLYACLRKEVGILSENIRYTERTIAKIIAENKKPIKKPLPKTWEEYGESNRIPDWLSDWVAIPKKHKALGKLEILRDVYNDGQQLTRKCGLRVNNENKVIISFDQRGPLEFNNTDIAEEFKSVFESLIIEAKPLL